MWGGPKDLVHKACFTWGGPGQLGQKVSSQTTALMRNPGRKEKPASARPVLEIYSASGVPLASLLVSTLPALRLGAGQGSASRGQFPEPPSPLQWKSGPVVSLGWSAEEELLCVQEDGVVLVYGLHGDFRRHFSMGNVGAPGGWGKGMESGNLRLPQPTAPLSRRCSRTGF